MNSKLNMLLFFAFILILSLNFYIKSEENISFAEEEFYDCHNKEEWDSLKIINQMLGTWLWSSTECPIYANKSKKRISYKLVFDSNSKLEIYQENILYKEVKWFIEYNYNAYNMHTEPKIDKIKGTIFLCNDKVIFINSWVDGCDYYYNKIEKK